MITLLLLGSLCEANVWLSQKEKDADAELKTIKATVDYARKKSLTDLTSAQTELTGLLSDLNRHLADYQKRHESSQVKRTEARISQAKLLLGHLASAIKQKKNMPSQDSISNPNAPSSTSSQLTGTTGKKQNLSEAVAANKDNKRKSKNNIH